MDHFCATLTSFDDIPVVPLYSDRGLARHFNRNMEDISDISWHLVLKK